jgi:hypothetical protein
MRGLVTGLAVKQAEVGMVDREWRSVTMSAAAVDLEAGDVMDALLGYDAAAHGADTVAYLDNHVLNQAWFKTHRRRKVPRWARGFAKAACGSRSWTTAAALVVVVAAVAVGLVMRARGWRW